MIKVEIIDFKDRLAEEYQLTDGESARLRVAADKPRFVSAVSSEKGKESEGGRILFETKKRRGREGKHVTGQSLEGTTIPPTGLRLSPGESVTFPVKTRYEMQFSPGHPEYFHPYRFWGHEKKVRISGE